NENRSDDLPRIPLPSAFLFCPPRILPEDSKNLTAVKKIFEEYETSYYCGILLTPPTPSISLNACAAAPTWLALSGHAASCTSTLTILIFVRDLPTMFPSPGKVRHAGVA